MFGRCADEAKLAVTEAFGATIVCATHGRAENAASHRPPRVHIAATGRGIERGASGIVSEVFEAGLIFGRTAERARNSITGKIWTIFR
jgi:hypothetical protein